MRPNLSKQIIRFTTSFTTTKPTGILSVFLTEWNDKIIIPHLRLIGITQATLHLTNPVKLLIVSLDGISLTSIIAALIVFFTLDRILLCILNGSIVLSIAKGIDHVLTLATEVIINIGFWQLRVQIFCSHQVLIYLLDLCREHADDEIACYKKQGIEYARKDILHLFEIDLLHGHIYLLS